MAQNRRLELHEILCDVLGSRNVYFQPPSSIRMEYDAIRYERARLDKTPADNIPYLHAEGYQLTYIYQDPDSDVVRKIANLPRCTWNRHYTADNLNHDVFIIYY